MDKSKNLKKIFDYLDLQNNLVAKVLSVDPSLISRWQSGQRPLKASSEVLHNLACYLISKFDNYKDIQWLEKQFMEEEINYDFSSQEKMTKCLMIFLASDGDIIREKFLDNENTSQTYSINNNYINSFNEDCIKLGYDNILSYLNDLGKSLPNKSNIDVYLSCEESAFISNDETINVLTSLMNEKEIEIRLLICFANDTKKISEVITNYIQPLIDANLNISIVYGMSQFITYQTTFIFNEISVLLINEMLKAAILPVATIINDPYFIKETKKNFEKAYNYSQNLLKRYNDNFSRNILEIFHLEFALPGNLDIIKDSINPMYMSTGNYDKFLKKIWDKEEQFKWRSAEFARFKNGMDKNYSNGTVMREILSLKRLNTIAKEGRCKMPGLYFMATGVIYLDSQGCLDILNGYIKYLKEVPSFHLLILDEISNMNKNNCWHLKQNNHITLNGWAKDEHIFLYSNQLMITYEFQNYFNEIWNSHGYSRGKREETIDVLEDVACRLRKNFIDNIEGEGD